ncbi:MAG TPA: hypothetical protein VIH88_01145 [Candidatus Acidoferrales bacterium]
MDEAPTRKGFTNFPYALYKFSDSRFGPATWKLMSVAERNAQIAEEKRVAAEKLLAANTAADAAAATTPKRPPAAPAEPPTPSGRETPPDFSRHPRRCTICSHPDRDAIEGDFIRWCSPDQIARDYHIADRVSVYRHAHYAGLFRRRKREVARVLESFLESAASCPIEAADMIIRATRLYVRLNEHGEWVEAPRTQYLITGSLESTEPPDAAAAPQPAKRTRRAAQPDPASPKPARRKRSQKTLTATHPN